MAVMTNGKRITKSNKVSFSKRAKRAKRAGSLGKKYLF
jgi:hypothetical protein